MLSYQSVYTSRFTIFFVFRLATTSQFFKLIPSQLVFDKKISTFYCLELSFTEFKRFDNAFLYTAFINFGTGLGLNFTSFQTSVLLHLWSDSAIRSALVSS